MTKQSTQNIALFDLDHTLLPIDSDYEWGQFLCRIGAVDSDEFGRRNAGFFAQYQAGTLDPVEYLEFALGTLAQFSRQQLNDFHAQFMQEVRSHPTRRLPLLVRTRFQVLFHSPNRGSFRLSLTVLVHYRSVRSI